MDQSVLLLPWWLTTLLTFFLLASLPAAGLHVTPSHLYVHNGNRHHRFEIKCTGGVAGVIWMFKGQNLSADNPCQDGLTRKVCGDKLYITRVPQSYAGIYTCLDPTTGRKANARVQVQPQFADLNREDYITAVNDTVVLMCPLRPNVSGIDIWWTKQGQVIGLGERYTVAKASLDDSGTYTCVARNHPTARPATKTVVLHVYDPGSCKILSAISGIHNISVTLEITGTPPPQFSAFLPWHQLPISSTTRPKVVNVTRSIAGLNKSTLQVGRLDQSVNSGNKKYIIKKLCITEIVLPTLRPESFETTTAQHPKIPEGTSSSALRVSEAPPTLQFKMCLYIRFIPSLKFCERNPSFNIQARKLMKKLTKDLTFSTSLDCYYNGDIYGVFVENGTECLSLRFMMVASIELRNSFSLACRNASRIKIYLSQWSRNLTNGPIRVVEERNVNQTHCSSHLEGLHSNSTKECHRIFYCSRKSSGKDKTVCLNKQNHHFSKVRARVDHTKSIDLLDNPRVLCEESLEGVSEQKLP